MVSLPWVFAGVVTTSYLVLWGLVEQLPRINTRTSRRWRIILGHHETLARVTVLPRSWTRQLFRRVREKAGEQAVEELATELAFSLRAGRGVIEGLQASAASSFGPLGEALRNALGLYESGESLEKVLRGFASQVGTADVGFLCTVLLIGGRTGGDLPRMLSGTARVLRERRVLRAELMLETAEARWSAALVALTPVALLAFFVIFQPRFLVPLFGVAWGAYALVYAVVSWTLGVYLAWLLTRPARVFGDRETREVTP